MKFYAAVSHRCGFDFFFVWGEFIEAEVDGAQSHGLLRSIDRLSRPKQDLLIFSTLPLAPLSGGLDPPTLSSPILPNLNRHSLPSHLGHIHFIAVIKNDVPAMLLQMIRILDDLFRVGLL